MVGGEVCNGGRSAMFFQYHCRSSEVKVCNGGKVCNITPVCNYCQIFTMIINLQQRASLGHQCRLYHSQAKMSLLKFSFTSLSSIFS